MSQEMKDHQKENGYTTIANTILEKLAKTKLNGTQFRILMIVWRSTYGWHKKEHDLSLSYLSSATDIHKQQIKREIDKMIEDEILEVIKESTYTTSRVIGFNKNYANSVQATKKSTVSELVYPTVSENADPTVSELVYQKRNIKKNLKETDASTIFDYYMSLGLVKHTKCTTSMKTAIKKVVEEYDVETLKMLLDRHKNVVEQTKHKGEYKVKVRGIDVFLTQKVNKSAGSPIIYEEYLDGGAKYEEYFKKTVKAVKFITPIIVKKERIYE